MSVVLNMPNASEDKISNQVVTRLAEELLPEVKEMVANSNKPTELLNKKELCERVMHCSTTTFDSYWQYQPGFPHIGEGRNRRYSIRDVEKWISENQVRS